MNKKIERVLPYSATSSQGVHDEKSALGMPDRFMGVSNVTLCSKTNQTIEIVEGRVQEQNHM